MFVMRSNVESKGFSKNYIFNPLYEGRTNSGARVSIYYVKNNYQVEDFKTELRDAILYGLLQISFSTCIEQKYNTDGTPIECTSASETEKYTIKDFPKNFYECLEQQEDMEREKFKGFEKQFNDAAMLLNTFAELKIDTYVVCKNSDADNPRKFLLTPWTNGEAIWTDNLNEAFKFKSGEHADEAVSKFSDLYNVLPTSFLIREMAKKLQLKL